MNGKSLGYGEQSSRFLYTFRNVEWQAGALRAVGYDSAGKRIAEASKKTAGRPAAVRLTPRTRPAGLRADGADVALVDVEVVDAEANRCPTALDAITFSLEGPAEWRGGIAQGPDNFILSRTLPVENGVNRVIIRPTPRAARITPTATAKGLRPATASIVSRPSTVSSGRSTEMLDDGLAMNLERGPTPAGSSFTVSRSAVATQPYPLRVLLDDEVVFSGDTPRTLGYMTLSFPPAVGRRQGRREKHPQHYRNRDLRAGRGRPKQVSPIRYDLITST